MTMNRKRPWAAALLPLALIAQVACSQGDASAQADASTPAKDSVQADVSAPAKNSTQADVSASANDSAQADASASADTSVSTGDADGVAEHSDLRPLPGDKPLEHNPYRGNKTAIELGAPLYGQNCAPCHGLQAISGGFTPDLRELSFEWDSYFINRVLNGYKSKMPSFKDELTQQEIWAIKSYLDKRRYEYLDKDLAELYAMAGPEQDEAAKGEAEPSSGGGQ